jgi:hypothetical protein
MEFSVQDVKDQVQKIQTLMGDLMKQGEHYGASFPGDTKKNLLKPGADKLMFMFRLRPDFHQDIKELPNGHREVFTRCEIYHIESGQKIAEGVGSASTMESKYRWRNAARKCPYCGKETIIKGKAEYGGGWICFGKKGGCGAKFQDDDPAIERQETGKVENPDIADTYNTVIKISKKRAYVDAAITACAASDIFTQDLDDIDPETEIPGTPPGANQPAKREGRQERNVSPGTDATNEIPGVPPGSPDGRPEQTPRKSNPLVIQRKELGEKLIAVMIAQDPDGLDYFTDQERQSVKDVMHKAGAHPQGIAIVQGLIDKWGEELEKRKAAFKPVPFSDEPDNPTVPSMYTEQEPEEENRNDGFVDDIPWGNEPDIF